MVLFSQGLSPHGITPLNFFEKSKVILFTSVTEHNKNQEKREILQKKCGQVVQFPKEDEYETLIRIVGPICGFRVTDLIFQNRIQPVQVNQEMDFKFIK